MATATNIFAKNYLTTNEMLMIIDEMSKHDEAINREIVKVALVAQFTLKDLDKEEFTDCNEIYDYVVKKKIDFNKNIFNYQDLNDVVKQTFGLEAFMKNFIIGASEKLSESINNVNVEELQNVIQDFAEVKDKVDNELS